MNHNLPSKPSPESFKSLVDSRVLKEFHQTDYATVMVLQVGRQIPGAYSAIFLGSFSTSQHFLTSNNNHNLMLLCNGQQQSITQSCSRHGLFLNIVAKDLSPEPFEVRECLAVAKQFTHESIPNSHP